MEKDNSKLSDKTKEETPADLKKQANEKDGVKKGYNEKNPAQPQGAFKPDGKK